MKRKLQFGKRLVSLLLASLLVLLPCFSEDYCITEEELTKLEMTLQKQKQLIETQNNQLIQLNNQLMDLKEINEKQKNQLSELKIQLNLLDQQITTSNNALMNANQSLTLYEKEVKKSNWKVGLTVGGVTFTIAGIAGLVAGAFIGK